MSRDSDHVERARTQAARELPELLRDLADAARAEGTAAALEKAVNAHIKVVPGAAADNKTKYDNIPVVNVIIGLDMSVQTAVEPAPVIEAAVDVVDAEPKSDWPFPQVTSEQAIPELDALALLDQAGAGMVLPEEFQ